MGLILPIPSLVRHEMTLYQKLVLIGTFAWVFFTCIVSALRLQAIVTVDFNDCVYSISHAMTYIALELTLAIVLACVATLHPLLPSRTGWANDSVARSGGTSLKWRFHPNFITYGGSRMLDMKEGSMPCKEEAAEANPLNMDTGSECELTIGSVGTAYHVGARSPRLGRQHSEETTAKSTN